MNQDNISSLNTAVVNTENALASNTLNNTVLWTALVTPFTENNTIDFASLAAIARKQAKAGNGIVLLGSTGEGLALTRAEKTQIVEFVCGLELNTPLMVAVGGHNLPEQTAWVEQCNHYAIDAYLLGTPVYAKPGVIGQTQWFEQLLNTANFPCMLYNVPSRSCVEIPVQTVKNLSEHPNFWAMKEASGDINKFLAYRQAVPHVALFSGEDGMMPYLANAGVKGLVSVCANAWPVETKRYVELSLSSETQTLFPLWNKAIASLFSVANPIPVKVLMQLQGEISLPNLRAPLTHLELSSSDDIQNYDQQIKTWFVEQQATDNQLTQVDQQTNQAIGA
jgi:4-hydroxy-tetrahydrodipicolinate synthase